MITESARVGAGETFSIPDLTNRNAEVCVATATVAVYWDVTDPQIIDDHTPNELTARVLEESFRGENIEYFDTKEELFADLGL